MCGIIAFVGSRSQKNNLDHQPNTLNCANLLVQGLRRLEYRGYDSSGVAVFNPKRRTFSVVKAAGKLDNILPLLNADNSEGMVGIGHTRWATHGQPNAINAHPHRVGKTVLVHNGIIENYDEIRSELLTRGRTIVSETDSELFGHLVEENLAKQTSEKLPNNFRLAVSDAFQRLEGSCSIVVAHDDFADEVIAIRNGTPLVATYSKKTGGAFVASDAQALIEHNNEIIFLENEDLVSLTPDGLQIFSLKTPTQQVERPVTKLNWSAASIDKAGYAHYMLKEIHEQPRAILDTLDTLIDRNAAQMKVDGLDALLDGVERVHIVACGTAWHAGLITKYFLESETRLPCEVDLASEYRYRNPVINKNTLVIAISESGETADTLAAVREAKRLGGRVAAICNVRGSTLTRDVDVTLFTACGPEIGVASTKAFTTQVLVGQLLAQHWAMLLGRKTSFDLAYFLRLPHLVQAVLDKSAEIKKLTLKHMNSKGFLFIARGTLFPVVLEGALKMKEISYIHAEGYPAGELKHGPIAMVEASMSVVVVAPRDHLFEKTVSNLQEVKARGGRIIAIGNTNDDQLRGLSEDFLGIPFDDPLSHPILAVIPMQILAYEAAVFKGTDVDQPRNLAKSVTVE